MNEYSQLMLERQAELVAIQQLQNDTSWYTVWILLPAARARLATVEQKIRSYEASSNLPPTITPVPVVQQLQQYENEKIFGIPRNYVIVGGAVALTAFVVYKYTKGKRQ